MIVRSGGLLLAAMFFANMLPAAELHPLLPDGAQSVTFKLKDKDGKTPLLYLFTDAQQADTAESINYWRGTPDPDKKGVAVEFKGIRFLRSEPSSDELTVRLIGIKNELELNKPISLDELQSGRPLRMHFGPVDVGVAFVTGRTGAEMLLNYDPRQGTLEIPEVSGEFSWKRLFHDPQEDAGGLTEVSGEVGEVPPGGAILKAAEE